MAILGSQSLPDKSHLSQPPPADVAEGRGTERAHNLRRKGDVMSQTFEYLEAAAFEQFQKCKGAAWAYLGSRTNRASGAEIEEAGDNLFGQCVELWVLLSRMPGDKRDVSVFFKRKRGDILGVDTLGEEGNAWFLG